MPLIPPTAARVPWHTDPAVNGRIRQRMEVRIARLRWQGRAAIEARLRALDHEWDIERCLETGAASLTLLGSVLGLTRHRRWMLLPLGVAGFLLQHAVQGWCPPLPLLRRLGVRTVEEIDEERTRLLAMLSRGPARAPSIGPAVPLQRTRPAGDTA